MDMIKLEAQWNVLLSTEQIDFVQAYLVTRSVAAAAEMMSISRVRADKYLASPTVQSAIKIAQKQLRADFQVTPEEVIADLRLLRDMSLGRIPVPETKWLDGQPVTRYVRQFNATAANKAMENMGRVVGLFTDRKEIVVPATDNQLRKRLEDLLGVSLEIEDAIDITPNTPQNDTKTPPESPQNGTDLPSLEQQIDALLAAEESTHGHAELTPKSDQIDTKITPKSPQNRTKTPPNSPQNAASDDLTKEIDAIPPDYINAAFEQLEHRELTRLLAAACKEQGV